MLPTLAQLEEHLTVVGSCHQNVASSNLAGRNPNTY